LQRKIYLGGVLCTPIASCGSANGARYGERYDWNLIEEASAADRSGSAVLEYLIMGKFPKIHDMDYAELREVPFFLTQ
jgi:superfamily I DNA and/or RNA helicase